MKVFSFTNLGSRTNNEDYLGSNDNCFVVCDGMGGHVSGEIASKFVVDNVLESTIAVADKFTKPFIQELLTGVQEKMNSLLEEQPELAKMGTTFTGLFKSEEAYFLSHIGDSRVYYIKAKDKLIWHSWDHSLVGELLKKNEVTWEKGRTHPMSSRISKAITANEDAKTVKSDIAKISNVEQGDIFMLCSDGVTEAWMDHELMDLLCDENKSSEEKLNTISSKCQDLSKDNNTCFLLEAEENDIISNGENEDINFKSLQFFLDNYQEHLKKEAEEDIEEDNDDVVEVIATEPIEKEDSIRLSREMLKRVLYALIGVILIYIVVQLFSSDDSIQTTDDVEEIIEVEEDKKTNAIIIDNKINRREEINESQKIDSLKVDENLPSSDLPDAHLNEEVEEESSIESSVESSPEKLEIDSIMIK